MSGQSKTEKRTEFVYKTTLKTVYGLTDSWIKRLGPPDKEVPNPHRLSTKSYLYRRARVELFIEAHQAEYERLLSKRAERSKRATAVADRRAQSLLTWAKDVPIVVNELPRRLRDLERATEAAFVDFRAWERNDYDTEFTMSYNALVAFVRHNATDYEWLLSEIEGKPGCGEAYLVLKQRANQAVESKLKQQYGIRPPKPVA
ncbi:MAG: hypothetical protein ACE5JP_14440 [Candidatus Bipolaricaulia bacterium]